VGGPVRLWGGAAAEFVAVGLTTVGLLLILLNAPCSCSIHNAAQVPNAVVESSSGALGAGFEIEVKLVALVLGIGKDEGDAIVAAHLAGEEA